MNKITTVRHSLAHILAYAIQELYPGVKFGIGPAIEDGFYYDFDFRNIKSPNIDDLPKIEKKMKEIIKKNLKFEKKYLEINEVKKIFKDQPYKLELIKDLEKENNQKVSIYKTGNFIDLCKGPHVKSTKEILVDAFKLIKISGAYWKGSEKNPMLTRICGVAFETEKELDEYLKREAEAKKRDHRELGKKLDFFHIDDIIGPGLILWHPKGAILKRIVENYALEEYLKAGYYLVSTPHIAKIDLWKTSGHLDFYRDNMFPPMHMQEIDKEEKEDYEIKPMNCPFHIAIYKQNVRSYRNLPIRYTEMGTVYRYEKSGTLHGLTRVRGFTQDDAHIFSTPEQLSNELVAVLKLTLKIFKKFGFKEYNICLSTRPEKYIGTPQIWRKAENSLKYALNKLNLKYKIAKGEGAFYGPKIDINLKDTLGREWQCTTIQVDFNLPERFDVTYIDKKGKKQRPIMVHRALLGSLERFLGVLLEYYAGALPFWLSPEQIWIIPIGSNHVKYAKEVAKEIISKVNSEFVENRIILKDEKETVSKKIREGEIQKIPYLLVVGDKEIDNKSVRVRQREKGDIGEMTIEKFLEKIQKELEK